MSNRYKCFGNLEVSCTNEPCAYDGLSQIPHVHFDGAVVVLEETDPNEYACFGANLEGYCEVHCRFRSWCTYHSDALFIREKTLVVILVEESC